LPLGHEFTSLVLALLWTGGHPPKVEPDVIEQIKGLSSAEGDTFNFEVYMSLTCHNCPDVVQALSLMAILNPNVKTTVIEGGAFQQEVSAREIMAVPMVFLNGKVFGSGRMLVEEIVAKLDTGAAGKEASKMWSGGRSGGRVRRAQGHSHWYCCRALWWSDQRHAGD
jgi:alkyl hydroperoxide reductase subunit F